MRPWREPQTIRAASGSEWLGRQTNEKGAGIGNSKSEDRDNKKITIILQQN
jgi:hypothetical protein